MFPEGLVYGEAGFGTPITHSIYTLLASDSLDESRLVAPQGFGEHYKTFPIHLTGLELNPRGWTSGGNT